MYSMKRNLLPFIGGLCVCLAACSHAPVQVSEGASVPVSQQVMQGLADVRAANAYQLQPGDLLEIQVFMEDDMQRTLRVSGGGSVTFPLVGNVQVAGYTVSEAESRLAEALKTYLKNPQVSILIKEYGNKTVYVLGQVTKPAAIQLPPEKSLTVLEAITSVGGFTDVAATSKVRVLRMENGVQKALDVDVTQITKQGNKALDITLLPGDVVFVPQSMF